MRFLLPQPKCCLEQHLTRYDYVVVGHFLPWKRSWSILQKTGRRLAIGEVYDHIDASLQMMAHFAQEGVTVSSMVPAHELADIYRSGHFLVTSFLEL